jgi:hypothetical protein
MFSAFEKLKSQGVLSENAGKSTLEVVKNRSETRVFLAIEENYRKPAVFFFNSSP